MMLMIVRFLFIYVRIQSAMRYHGIRGSIAAHSELTDVEDRFDVLVDANDQLLERVVSAFWHFNISLKKCKIPDVMLNRYDCQFLVNLI